MAVGGLTPDWEPDSDDDETLEPWYNDTGDFGDNQPEGDFDDEED